mmetsp:Transcript_16145/g.48821  ORF Transcript_16145/g.48821 Transcript_16145/m.48821 type:complete len:152 (-) Transcript_16145:72-527(-)
MQHFPRALELYQRARASNGKLVVHCVRGINRSAAIALALYMWSTRSCILQAASHVNHRRGTCLSNSAFCEQLVHWARSHNLLHHHHSSDVGAGLTLGGARFLNGCGDVDEGKSLLRQDVRSYGPATPPRVVPSSFLPPDEARPSATAAARS